MVSASASNGSRIIFDTSMHFTRRTWLANLSSDLRSDLNSRVSQCLQNRVIVEAELLADHDARLANLVQLDRQCQLFRGDEPRLFDLYTSCRQVFAHRLVVNAEVPGKPFD